LEGSLTGDEHARLEQWLREDAECRRFYLASVDQHARLLTQPALAEGKLTGARPKFQLHRWFVPAAAAAAFAVLAAAVLWKEKGPEVATPAPEQTGNGCAVLAQSHDAVFADGVPPQAGAILKPGLLRLQSGLVRIEFFSGATVLLEGQADLEIVSAWEAACQRGKARVRVPPPAQGFRLQAPGMKLVDLGTEFGVQVGAGGGAQVHVFEGEVEAHPQDAEMRLLKGGESFQTGPVSADLSRSFTSIEQFDELRAHHSGARHDAWWQWFQEMRHDPRLIACYAFKHWKDDRWDRLVNNFAEPRNPSRAGAAVGSRWTQGRWPMKDALEFRGPGDRVRINLGNERYNAVTLACWVRVDGLDRKYNALLLTDGYEPGEPHWQIYEDGRLMFSIAYPDEKRKRNQIYYSPSIFNLANQRRWHHIAVAYDTQNGAAVQYLDGEEISREISPFHQPGRSIGFGACEIGNWGLPTEGHQFPIRNLNGCVDEMLIYGAALNAAEVRQLYLSGKPD
ncbi:MAG TPA: LamG domain-containing protein, partial [Prosthecobacter sp.]|nr:LamG domain-containing protein [Prosthecobacter sp.]